MALSMGLISEFVKSTKDTNTAKKETIAYGTVMKVTDDATYVQLDGSDIQTPVSRTTEVAEGNRVTVMIKNHVATITGNISSPAVVTTTIDNILVDTAKIKELESDTVEIKKKLTTAEADIDDLEADNVIINKTLTSNEADIKKLSSDNVTINEKLTAAEGDIDKLEASNLTINEKLTAAEGSIDKLEANNASINEKLTAAEGDIDKLEATNLTVNERLTAAEGTIADLKADNLTATDAAIKYANIDFSNIGKAAMEYFYSKSGLIKDITIGDATISGEIVGVTIRGDRIIGNTIAADKLVIKGSDGIYYKLNIEGGATTSEEVTEEQLQNGLHGDIIIAKTITAEKITVDDLVAFDATIGGFNITANSIYSGAKESADNTTQGVYLDSSGQISIGDASNFIRYYLDTDGTYKLEISSIDNITIGGRNLLRNSTNIGVNSAASGLTHSTTEEGYLQIIAESGNDNWVSVWLGGGYTYVEDELSEGDEYVISFTMRSPDSTYLPSVYIKAGMGYYDLKGKLSTEWSTVWYAGVWKDTNPIVPHLGFSNRVGTYEIKNCKIERGNKATDWTPAPEDMATASQVLAAETKITQNSEAIALRATKSELTKAVEEVEVGGRNLVSISRFQEARNVTSTKEFELRNAWVTTYISNANLVEILDPATEYTIKYDLELIERTDVPTVFDMRVGFLIYSATKGTWISLATNMSDSAEIGTKQTVQKTFITPEVWNDESFIGYSRRWTTDGSDPIGHDAFRVTNFKIEKGNKATDWTPAPEEMATVIEVEEVSSIAEDAQARVSTTEALIEILSESISMLVTDGSGASLMTQTENGWTFSTGAIQELVDRTSEDLNNLTNEVGDVNSAVNILQQAVDDLGEIAEYVKIGTYEDEPCIELGEGDSDFKLRITNTRMIFTEGSNILAYFNNQSLHIKKAVVEEEFQQGGFVWKIRSNGNLALVWKGEDS